MVSLTTTARREDGVTLVECRLESARPRRVRVANRLDGPVWPPRRRGVPAAGWDEDGASVTVAGPVGLGYATPAPPADPPATITRVGDPPAATDCGTPEGSFATEFDVSPTPAGVVRSLSDPRPPRGAVPAGGTGTGHGASRGEPDGTDATAREPRGRTEGPSRPATPLTAGGEPSVTADPGDADAEPTEEIPATAADSRDTDAAPSPSMDPGRLATDDPVPPEAWLRAVERRVELLEGVGAATTLPAATTAVAAAGGLDGVSDLAVTVEAERAVLLGVARRAEALAGRAAAAEPDLETLRRLA